MNDLNDYSITYNQQSEQGSFSKEEIGSRVNRGDISHIFFKIEKLFNNLFIHFKEIIEATNKYNLF